MATPIQKLKAGQIMNGGLHRLTYDEQGKEFVLQGKNAKGENYERRYKNGHVAVRTYNIAMGYI